MQFLKVFRPLNLFIVLLVCMVMSVLGDSLQNKESVDLVGSILNSLKYGLLAVLIAAAGYLINDFYDQKIDAINKPEKVFPFSNNTVNIIYGLINIIAVSFAFLFYRLFLLFEH